MNPTHQITFEQFNFFMNYLNYTETPRGWDLENYGIYAMYFENNILFFQDVSCFENSEVILTISQIFEHISSFFNGFYAQNFQSDFRSINSIEGLIYFLSFIENVSDLSINEIPDSIIHNLFSLKSMQLLSFTKLKSFDKTTLFDVGFNELHSLVCNKLLSMNNISNLDFSSTINLDINSNIFNIGFNNKNISLRLEQYFNLQTQVVDWTIYFSKNTTIKLTYHGENSTLLTLKSFYNNRTLSLLNSDNNFLISSVNGSNSKSPFGKVTDNLKFTLNTVIELIIYELNNI